MELRNLEINKIKFANVAYYNPDWKSCELKDDDDLEVYHEFIYPEKEALVLLYETENGYINLLNPDEKCNVFKWKTIVEKIIPLHIYLDNGHEACAIEYSCGYEKLSGEEKEKCYILDKNRKFHIAFGYTEPTISYDRLIQEIIKHRKIFYADRLNVVLGNDNITIVDKAKVFSSDFARSRKYQSFCNAKEKANN